MDRDRRIARYCAELDGYQVAVVTPLPCCGECNKFQPDPINPPAGLGNCLAGHGPHYPMQRPNCNDHKPISR
jgi:hypothetical protein